LENSEAVWALEKRLLIGKTSFKTLYLIVITVPKLLVRPC
jgi:hypothetical protein